MPHWARRDRYSDMHWIAENLHVFWPAARQQYDEQGRGAIVVDTTVRPTGAGHPFTYLAQEQVDETHDADAQRMVREYDPTTEVVIVMLKPKNRVSVYRFQAVSVWT